MCTTFLRILPTYVFIEQTLQKIVDWCLSCALYTRKDSSWFSRCYKDSMSGEPEAGAIAYNCIALKCSM